MGLSPEIIDKIVADAREVWPTKFERYEKGFNDCSLSIALDILKRLGLFQKEGERHTIASALAAGKVVPEAAYLVSKLMTIMEEEGLLAREGEYYTRKKIGEEPAGPAELLCRVTRDCPEEGAPFQWLARAYCGMPDFVLGRVKPEDIMFPEGDFSLVTEVYNTSEVYSFYPKLSGRAIRHLVTDHYKRKVKLLEIGAGTGNGTANVFEQIADGFERYVYTDVGRTLVKQAKTRFSSYDFIDYLLYDISKPAAGQKLEDSIGTFDIILGVNVFHATPNARQALRHAMELLAPGGCLVLSEIAPPKERLYRYMDLTFGLLPSFHEYEDKDLRPDNPIVRPEVWVEIYKKAGFHDPIALPGDQAGFEDRGGVVLGFK